MTQAIKHAAIETAKASRMAVGETDNLIKMKEEMKKHQDWIGQY